MPEALDDLDRSLALVMIQVGGAEIREGDRRGVALLHVPGEEQDRVSPLRNSRSVFWNVMSMA